MSAASVVALVTTYVLRQLMAWCCQALTEGMFEIQFQFQQVAACCIFVPVCSCVTTARVLQGAV